MHRTSPAETAPKEALSATGLWWNREAKSVPFLCVVQYRLSRIGIQTCVLSDQSCGVVFFTTVHLERRPHFFCGEAQRETAHRYICWNHWPRLKCMYHCLKMYNFIEYIWNFPQITWIHCSKLVREILGYFIVTFDCYFVISITNFD